MKEVRLENIKLLSFVFLCLLDRKPESKLMYLRVKMTKRCDSSTDSTYVSFIEVPTTEMSTIWSDILYSL